MAVIDVEALKQAWFTYEEIESIKMWVEDIDNGRTISEDEMSNFVRNELFSKYMINV